MSILNMAGKALHMKTILMSLSSSKRGRGLDLRNLMTARSHVKPRRRSAVGANEFGRGRGEKFQSCGMRSSVLMVEYCIGNKVGES